jgi:adenine deaminase
MSHSILEGNLVDVVDNKIYPARVTMDGGKVTAVEKLTKEVSGFLLPGFIDAHVHIDSSQLCPSRFAEAAVAHGTTAVVTDPHEMANVMGMEGVEYMVRDAKGVPLRIFFTAPSCVPATPFEGNGATLGAKEVDTLLRRKEFVALGEVMDYPGVIRGDKEVLAKIKAARENWKPVDGHCPGLSGPDLVRYINAGINTEHECTTADEAEEKYRLGMWIMVRESAAERNLRDLMPFAKANECFLVTDDLQAAELCQGHLDSVLRKAVLMGMSPIHAIRAVTAWPAWHYYLPGGSIAVGRTADIVVVDDLRDFRVREVYIDGALVAKDGKALFEPKPEQCRSCILRQQRIPEEFQIKHPGPSARARVICLIPGEIESKELQLALKVEGGVLQPSRSEDILLMAMVSRYREAPPALAFVRGFGLKAGAIASTVAHDSHNIIAVGTSADMLAKAINAVSEKGGYYITDGKEEERLELDVCGLMSTRPAAEVAAAEERINLMAKKMGCQLAAPMQTLAFQGLLVIPELKLSDRGLFDSRRMQFVDVVMD